MVALQIESLCTMKTDEDIRHALEDLPKDLAETFTRILQRSGESGQAYQQRVFQLVLAARRPLSTEELREALSVTPGDTVWNQSKLVNDIHSTLACCGSLITVDEEESTVRVLHHSVKQFLINKDGGADSVSFPVTAANKAMADVILTYLNYGVFDTRVSTRVVPQLHTGSAPSEIIRSTIERSSHSRNIALKLLRMRRQANFDIGKTLSDAGKVFDPPSVVEFHFLSYAKRYWTHHLDSHDIPNEPTKQDDMMRRALLDQLVANKILDMNAADENGTTPLHWAAIHGLTTLCYALINYGGVDIDLKDTTGSTPLACAARYGHSQIFFAILGRSYYTDVNSQDLTGRTALSLAACYGHEDIVAALLIDKHIDINIADRKDRTALVWAAISGHESIVRLLLEHDASCMGDPRMIPLRWAVKNGHEGVVSVLLDPSYRRHQVYTQLVMDDILMLAVKAGQTTIIKRLLESGFDPNPTDQNGRTPLSLAAEFVDGSADIVKLLLDCDNIEPDKADNTKRTPLSYAAVSGTEAVVEHLLRLVPSGQVNLNSADLEGRTPLSWAAAYGNEAAVRLLLDCSQVEVNTADKLGKTPLSLAIDKGHPDVVKLFLDSGKV